MTSIIIKLLFDTQAEDAVAFYTGLFNDSKITLVTRYPNEREECITCGINPADAGSVMNVDFEISSTFFTAINGKKGPEYAYSSSISLLVQCKDNHEITHLYNDLCTNGKILSPLQTDKKFGKTAWVQDKFGVCWRLIISETTQQKIMPLLLFSGEQYGRAKEAITFYTNLFQKSNIQNEIFDKHILTNETWFSLVNQNFIGMDTQDDLPYFSEATSFIILCNTQEEVDYYWNELSKEGDGFYREASAWLIDKYGIWWQMITFELTDMMRDTENLQHSIEELEKTELINIKQIKANRDNKV